MTFHTKILWMQNHWVFGLKKIDGFTKIYDGIRLLAIILQESALIHIILYL